MARKFSNRKNIKITEIFSALAIAKYNYWMKKSLKFKPTLLASMTKYYHPVKKSLETYLTSFASASN